MIEEIRILRAKEHLFRLEAPQVPNRINEKKMASHERSKYQGERNIRNFLRKVYVKAQGSVTLTAGKKFLSSAEGKLF